jgi:hypothetical protein
VKPKPYRPSIRSLQEDFAQRLTLKRMLAHARQGKPPPPKTITDNSEPWMENPDSVADYLEIARLVDERTRLWQSRFNGSSTS